MVRVAIRMHHQDTTFRPPIKAYAEWLDTLPWTFWCTLTTPYELTLKQAYRLASRTYDAWSELSGGRCTMFYAAERNQLRDGHHMHALVRLPEEFHQKELYSKLCDKYSTITGARKYRYCRITGDERWKSSNARIDLDKYDPKRAASGYLTKYLLKDRLSEYGIHHNQE